MTKPTLTNNVRSLREKRGISQEALAHEIGVTLGTINNWERLNTDIPGRRIAALATFFGCTMNDVMGVTGASDHSPTSRIMRPI